jgi:hypothetical protein
VLAGKKGQTVTDGPFLERKEEVGGYILLSARDLQTAVELARGCRALEQNGTVEVRVIQQMEGL